MQLRRGFAAASSRQVNAGAVVFALAALLAGCSGPSADKRLSSGQAHLERGDVRAAMIEAKAALQAQPESAAGRLLLARTLLAVGDLPGAEIELRRAERFGLAPAVAAPHAARLALAQGKPEVARQRLRAPEVSSAGAALDAEALTLLAQAERTLGNTAAAQAAVDQALAAAPANVPALALRVRLMADRGDVPAALAQLRMHTTLHPAAAELWQLSGELLGRDDARLADAAAALQKAVALDTRRGEAHAALVMVRLRQRDLAAAKAQAAELRKVLPGLPLADYLEGLVAFLSGDLPLARERMSMLMKSTEPQPQTLLLAGMVHARLADTAQAEAYFTAALTAAPAWAPPRRELAALHLRQGRPERALAILEPLLTPKRSGSDAEPAGADDADLWLLAGQAHARRADFRAADTAYARAKRLRPADAAVRKAMAKLDLARGDIDAGLRELQAVAAAERDDVGADLALISALMQRGERAAALKALQSAMAKRPVLALLPYLRGRILEEAAQVADARVAYEEALAREARFRPAIDALAALDLAERQPAKARQRYEALLKAEPNSAPTLLAMGELALRSGARVGEVNDWIDRSVRADPKDAGNWRAAVDLQRRLGDPTATLSRAQTAHAALPDDGELMLALADAQQFGGEAHQSVATLNRLLQRQPNSAQVQLRLALAYGLAAQPDAARAPLARAAARAGIARGAARGDPAGAGRPAGRPCARAGRHRAAAAAQAAAWLGIRGRDRNRTRPARGGCCGLSHGTRAQQNFGKRRAAAPQPRRFRRRRRGGFRAPAAGRRAGRRAFPHPPRRGRGGAGPRGRGRDEIPAGAQAAARPRRGAEQLGRAAERAPRSPGAGAGQARRGGCAASGCGAGHAGDGACRARATEAGGRSAGARGGAAAARAAAAPAPGSLPRRAGREEQGRQRAALAGASNRAGFAAARGGRRIATPGRRLTAVPRALA